MHRKALGKGLDALFKTDYFDEISADGSMRRIISVAIKDILPNPVQPRERITDNALDELKRSIAENGILEPPIVRRKGEFFEIVAGERRFRAARELGHEAIEVILMEVDSDEKMLVLSLIENIQREDLNAIEEARAYHQIMTRMKVTQEELAAIVGKSRSTVANTIRLLTLPNGVQTMIGEGILSPGSARTLVAVQDSELQMRLAKKITSEGLSAREAESLVKRTLSHKPRVSPPKSLSPVIDEVRENLQRRFGTSIKIKGDEKKGKIEIAYHSKDELEAILDALGSE